MTPPPQTSRHDRERAYEARKQRALALIPHAWDAYPQIPIIHRHALPPLRAVYLIWTKEHAVLSVGMTQNVRQRLMRHNRLPDMLTHGAATVAWLPQEDGWIGSEGEKIGIQRCQPWLNLTSNGRLALEHRHICHVAFTQEELTMAEACLSTLTRATPTQYYNLEEAIRLAAVRWWRSLGPQLLASPPHAEETTP